MVRVNQRLVPCVNWTAWITRFVKKLHDMQRERKNTGPPSDLLFSFRQVSGTFEDENKTETWAKGTSATQILKVPLSFEAPLVEATRLETMRVFLFLLSALMQVSLNFFYPWLTFDLKCITFNILTALPRKRSRSFDESAVTKRYVEIRLS